MASDQADAEMFALLEEAKKLGFSNPQYFPKIFEYIVSMINEHQKVQVTKWCLEFLYQAFSNPEIIDPDTRTQLAMDALDNVLVATRVRDMEVFLLVIDVLVILYKLTFKFITFNDGAGIGIMWQKLLVLKQNLLDKIDTPWPLEMSENDEHDLWRNLTCKCELIKFMAVVIDYQSASNQNGSSNNYFSLSKVNKMHSLIQHSVAEDEASRLVDLLLANISRDILIPQLFTATLNHLMVIMKRKPQFAVKILTVLSKYDSTLKLQSNYQTVEEFKLARKYCDRVAKVFISHALRQNMIPPSFKDILNQKINMLTERGNEIRKKNIFAIDDPTIQKRKWEGFDVPDKQLKVNDYRLLYCLTNPSNELTQFDLSSLPQNILDNMALTALSRVSTRDLARALDIILERYKYNVDLDVHKGGPNKRGKKVKWSDDLDAEDKNGANDHYDDKLYDSEDDDGYEEGEIGEHDTRKRKILNSLPPIKEQSFKQKKEHVSMIIENFFALANSATTSSISTVNNTEEEDATLSGETGVNKELTKTAIKSWKPDSWLLLLSRLATRGMSTAEDSESEDFIQNQELSDMIRNAIFEYFLQDIHGRIDLIISWLNEEWYSEQVLHQKEEQTSPSSSPIYDKWSAKVLDSIIPFLEPKDKKLFIRLVSDLPYLDSSLISRIKSLCVDPLRSGIGFLALQFLIMYRPPVKEVCIDLLRELSTSEQEDLKKEASKLLTKYQPQSV
ncbi:uncharacterized protein KQ657_001699 [Scheffersomyces spartinae]|uniref:Symplekin/Pta1 N-terminal domain-containing protein n=1 Tax=Scheffersomyces spartinae TaxID=45513 RepID=A0A9P8AHY1_9ASCO|nr:uncharacterized protein KQ657_001699 [Scheffersomyces spartinae]KAG7192599.1 hypothetical protein KQ657_001699 [Scheffersomyces spartinae]